MNREEIQNILPHRNSMLLLDEAWLNEAGEACGSYAVRGDEWFFDGHFPGNPVMPGVVQCEIIAQASCLLFADALCGKTAYYAGIDKVRFKNPVRPGDVCEITAKLNDKKGPLYFCSAKLEVGGKLCCKGELTFALVPKGES